MNTKDTAPAPDAYQEAIPWKTRITARSIRASIGAIAATWKVQWAEGQDRFIESRAQKQPVILATWHNRMLVYASLLEKEAVRKGWPWAIMASRSRDGNLGAELGRLARVSVARGSSGRGGASAYRQFRRLIEEESHSVILLAEGSRGPRYVAQKGACHLAKVTGVPLVPSIWTASSQWVLTGTWDHFRIPKPFARITLSWGEPIHIAPDSDKESIERERQRLESELNRLEQGLDFPERPKSA